jgi:hypothetical protein
MVQEEWKGLLVKSSGIEETGGTPIRPDQDSHFPITMRTAALVGVLFLVDIDAPVDVAAIKKNSKKFFLLRHHSPITCPIRTWFSIAH